MAHSRLRKYGWQTQDAAVLASTNRQTIDESGANQAFNFLVSATDHGTFDASARGNSDATHVEVDDVDDLTIVGSINDDSFFVNAAPLAAGSRLTLDGGAGIDALSIDFSALSIDFRIRADGTILSNYGTTKSPSTAGPTTSLSAAETIRSPSTAAAAPLMPAQATTFSPPRLLERLPWTEVQGKIP